MRTNLIGMGAGLVVALIGVALSNIPLVVLGVVVGLGIVAVGNLSASKTARVQDRLDDLSPDSRILVRPLRKICDEIATAAAGNSEALSPYIANEALQESKRLLNQSIAALLLRDRLVREGRSQYDAEKSIEDLQTRIATASSDDEKHSLQSAIDARKEEVSHYATLKEGISKIESSVKQAEAAMAEMRARMTTSASADLAAKGSDPLRDAVGRMQALSTSLVEAQEMLQR